MSMENLKKVKALADQLSKAVGDCMGADYKPVHDKDEHDDENEAMDQGEDSLAEGMEEAEEMDDDKPAKKAMIIASLKRKAY